MPQPTSPSPATSDQAPMRTSGLALASLVLGILSLPFWLFGSIPGIVCGVVGLGRIARSESGPGPRLRGRGAAIVGIIFSAIGLVASPILLLAPAFVAVQNATRDAIAMNNMKIVSFAMATAQATTGEFPGAIVDREGRPLLSWRVAILPFLEEAALYQEFHLDEPWDSEHNKALLGRMPKFFAAVGASPSRGMTSIVVPVAPGTAFGPPSDTGEAANFAHNLRPREVMDGLSNTAALVSMPGLEIPWTKPDDLDGDPAAAFAAAGKRGHLRVVVATGDGAVTRIPTAAKADAIRAFFSKDGHDTFSDDDLE